MSFSKVLALCLFLMSFYLTGCTSDNTTSSTEKVFHFGTTAYGIEMGNTGLNPHHDYSGWSAVRYGVVPLPGLLLFQLLRRKDSGQRCHIILRSAGWQCMLPAYRSPQPYSTQVRLNSDFLL